MPNIGDVYRVIAKGRLMSTVETRNMFTYGLTAANGTDEQFAVAAETLVGNAFDALKANLSIRWALYELETQKWYPAAGGNPGYWLGYHTSARSVVGTAGGDLTGYQPAALLLLKTAAKRVLGRKFLAGIPESLVADGSLIAAIVTALATFCVSILGPVSFGAGGSGTLGVLDKNGSFNPIISTLVGNIVSSMRRRKPGYGI